MSLFSRAFERRHVPDPVTGQVLLDILAKRGGTKAGVNVTEISAVNMTAVYRAAAILSGVVAGLPLKTYRNSNQQETNVRVVQNPNDTQTAFEVRELQAVHLVLWGNSYSLKVRDGSGRVVEIWPILPDKVEPKIVKGKKVFDINTTGEKIRTDDREILHIPGLGYDGVKGLSPIQLAAEAIGGSLAAEAFGNAIYTSGATIGGLITTPRRLTSTQAKGIKQRWKDTVGGVKNAYDIGILDQGMKFEKMTMPPNDIQFLESRQFQVVEIARLYGIPPHLLMDVNRSTSWGTGIEEQTIGFVTFTVKPGYLQRIESRYTREVVPAGQFAEFKIDGLLRGSSKIRADVYTKALSPKTGWMTRDEVRELENLSPAEDDDVVEAEPIDITDEEAANLRDRSERHIKDEKPKPDKRELRAEQIRNTRKRPRDNTGDTSI